MPRRVRAWIAVAAAATVAGTLGGCAGDEGDASPLAGETIELVVPYGPGGGYDVYARAVAPYLGECLDAQVVVRNQPGAGGLLATSETAVAEPDGLRIQIMNMVGFAAAQIAEADGVRYDLSEFSFLGRVSSAPSGLVVGADSAIASFDDVIESSRPVRFVATGPGSEGYIVASVLADAYGFPLELITGFSSSEEARTAVVAGNADVEAVAVDSQLSSIESGEVRPVALVDDQPLEVAGEMPLVSEFPAGDAQRQSLVDRLVELGQLGRAIAAPPGVPGAVLASLRDGFGCAMGDEQLLGELEDQQRPVDVLDGPQLAERVGRALDPPPAFEASLREAF